MSINPVSCSRQFHIKQTVKGQRDWTKTRKISCNTDLTAKEFHQRWTLQSRALLVRGPWWRSWFRYCAKSGFDGTFHWHNPSGRTMALESTQPRTEISTRNISWRPRPVRRVDNLTVFMCRMSRNPAASTSWNPQGLSRTVQGLLYLYVIGNSSQECGRFTFIKTILTKTPKDN